MSKSRKILVNGLKKLNDLETGKIKPICYIKMDRKFRKNHDDDLNDHDDDIESKYEHVLITEDTDIFNKKEIKISIIDNYSLINEFPNALLLEQAVEPNIDKEKEDQIENDKKKKAEDTEDIWDIINQIKKDNISESLDTLTTDTDTMTNCEDIDIIKILCKGCGSASLIEDQRTSVIVCSDCGMVNEELLDHGPEWRQYSNDDNRGEGQSRCGCPSNFFFPKSSQGTIMAGSSNSRLKRKQKWNSMVYKERSLNLVFEYISRICSKSNIPRIIVDTAKILYKKLSDCKHKSGPSAGKQIIIRGENRLSIIAACLFKACEMNKSPRNVKEIAEFFGLDEKKVTKGNKQFEKIMKNADDNNIIVEQFKTNTTEDYIRRYCSHPKLRINKDNTDLAVRISKNCSRMKLASDHNPGSIAAGSIVIMIEYCDLDIERSVITKIFNTSDVTINKIYKKISQYANALVDDETTDHLIKKFKING